MQTARQVFWTLIIWSGIISAAYAGHGRIQHRGLAGAGQTLIKTVPAGATLEYRINGQIAQSMPISPGIYRISVERLR